MIDSIGPYLLGPNDTEENGIYTGDARELAKAIPSESIDLIFTDPVYDQMDDYKWLAKTGARILKNDRACLAFCGIGYLGETITAMQAGFLAYRWQIILSMPYRNGSRIKGGFSHYISCLWFERGDSKPRHSIKDTRLWRSFPIKNSRFWKSFPGIFKWAKNIPFVSYYMKAFTQEGGVSFDPFTGSGTVPVVCKMLNRKYLAFEIDPDAAQMARDRVRETQPPLPISIPEQGELL